MEKFFDLHFSIQLLIVAMMAINIFIITEVALAIFRGILDFFHGKRDSVFAIKNQRFVILTSIAMFSWCLLFFLYAPFDPYLSITSSSEISSGLSFLVIIPILLFFAVWSMIKHGGSVVILLGSLIIQASSLIVGYAGVYIAFGLENFAPPVERVTALYFSIVTWTTLGYGDFQPSESMRLVAASEAMLGYIYLALLVGTIMVLVTESFQNYQRDQYNSLETSSNRIDSEKND